MSRSAFSLNFFFLNGHRGGGLKIVAACIKKSDPVEMAIFLDH